MEREGWQGFAENPQEEGVTIWDVYFIFSYHSPYPQYTIWSFTVIGRGGPIRKPTKQSWHVCRQLLRDLVWFA